MGLKLARSLWLLTRIYAAVLSSRLFHNGRIILTTTFGVSKLFTTIRYYFLVNRILVPTSQSALPKQGTGNPDNPFPLSTALQNKSQVPKQIPIYICSEIYFKYFKECNDTFWSRLIMLSYMTGLPLESLLLTNYHTWNTCDDNLVFCGICDTPQSIVTPLTLLGVGSIFCNTYVLFYHS